MDTNETKLTELHVMLPDKLMRGAIESIWLHENGALQQITFRDTTKPEDVIKVTVLVRDLLKVD